MPISDKKKCQTLINGCADAAIEAQAAVAKLKATRTLYQAVSPDTTGTPLDGNVVAVSNWIDALDTLASGAVPTAMIAARVPSHRGKALEE